MIGLLLKAARQKTGKESGELYNILVEYLMTSKLRLEKSATGWRQF